MPEQVIGKIPEFTSDESAVDGTPEEVNEAAPVEVAEEGKETPAELPAADQPGGTTQAAEERQPEDDQLHRAVQGLQNERAKLLKEISELKGQRREIKRDELMKVDARIDELKDVNPNDVNLIDRVLRAKGFVTKDEANKMFYDAVKQDSLTKFLDRYPEYKPENDSGDVNWTALQRELGFYRMPTDPHLINEVLERAHRGIVRVPAPATTARKRQAQIASVGSGGAQRSPTSTGFIDARKRAMLEAGGWTQEEIERMEQKQR